MDKPDERGYVANPTPPDERGYSPDSTQVVEYATPPKVNAEARRSLIYGALLIVPFVTGFLAIRHGMRGSKIAEETGLGRRTSLLGFILGVANFMLWIGILISLPFAYANARRAQQQIQCITQLRQMSVGILLYAQTNGGWTPPTLSATPVPTLTCPAAPAGTSNYVYVAKPIRMNSVARPSAYVTIYEPVTNHARGTNIAFLDGHVEMVPPATAQKMINELNAGFNPPRAGKIK